MKTKEIETKTFAIEKTLPKSKPKSLRPMRSLVASRSFKPKTTVATMVMKEEMVEKSN